MKPANYFIQAKDGKVVCQLCPHNCVINQGKRGICGVRKNIGQKLFSENYGKVCSIRFDPIEKKPLYHYYPGKNILSVGTVGCNLSCKFCQNFEISQNTVDDFPYLNDYSPREVVAVSLKENDNIGVSYTYNEPTVWFEFVMDTAKIAHQEGLKNVIVTNGYINPEPLKDLCRYIDAFSIDLKAFNNDFYKRLTSSTLQPVLETLKYVRDQQKHFEITNLVITDENDDEKNFEEMIKWISDELGSDTVLHLSRYFPTYKMTNDATPVSTLENLYEIASKHLNYVYVGNVRTDIGQNTYCKNCKELAISRYGYVTTWEGLDDRGNCVNCDTHIISQGQ